MNEIIVVENAAKFVQITSCTCLGHVVTYECTIMRGLGTVWRGNAFDCASSDNEIYLLESHFNSSERSSIMHMQQWDMITGRINRIDGGFYTSQLSVTVSSDLIGKNVSCAQSDGSTTDVLIGSPITIHNTAGM